MTRTRRPASSSTVVGRGHSVTHNRLWLGVAIVLVAASLRAPVTSLGALLSDIQDAVGVKPVLAGLLTSVPPLVFGLVGLAVPRLMGRWEEERAVTWAMLIVVAGTGIRGVGGVPLLVLGTVIAMAGVAVVNVLLPVVVRRGYPARHGWMTGTYVSAIQLGGAAGAALSVPIADFWGGWEGGLTTWAAPAAVGLVVWIGAASRGRHRRVPGESERSSLSWGMLLRDRTALAVTIFFGLQSALAYVVFGWLPSILRESGTSPATAGNMLALAIAISIPVSLVVPGWLASRPDQRSFVWVLVAAWGGGFLGLALAPTAAPWLWATLLGCGVAGFPVGLLLMRLRSATTSDTTWVSAFAQGVGYLIALPAPLLFGVVFAVPRGRVISLWLLIALLVPLAWSGHRAGRATFVGARGQ